MADAAGQSAGDAPKVLWRHPRPEQTSMYRFKQRLEQEKGIKFNSFKELHKWSINNQLAFWEICFKQFPLISSGTPTAVVQPHSRIDEVPNWFPGVNLNFAENILYTPSPSSRAERSTVHKRDSDVAFVEVREAMSSRREVTWGQLRDRTAVFAAALKAHGVRTGDRVAVVMNNSFDTLCVFLATASLGAIFSSSSTDMGTKGILERLIQIEPKWVFVDDAALYNGRHTDLRQKMKEVVEGMKGATNFQGLVSVPWSDQQSALNVKNVPRTTSLQDFLAPHLGNTAKDLRFERVPFNADFLCVYSSGTTGQPKCIVHAVGKILLSSYKECLLHREVSHESVMQQFTTTGWIMYLSSVVSLLLGCKVIMYDGSPFLPGVDAFLQLAAREKATHLGISPRWLQAIRSAGIVPKRVPGTESLQLVISTGMVLPTEMFKWFYSEQGFHAHTHLGNMSGGTDIAGCFADPNPLDPVYDIGGCQGFTLGMDVRVYDQTIESMDGSPVVGKDVPIGQPGELVCTKAFPNMPAHFWGDDGGKKYHGAYFGRFDNVWTHGDFIQVDPVTNAVIFLGRSDGVLNPSGIRFGSAEIYSVLENGFKDEVEDSICIGQRRKQDTDESVVLFLKMNRGKLLTPKLSESIKQAIASGLSKRHVPKYIFETPEIPATINGKKVEMPVKRIISGEVVKPSGTLANPGCLEYYYQFVNSEAKSKEGLSKL